MNKEYKIKLDLNKKLYNKKMAFNQFDENVNDFYIEVTKNNKLVKDLDKSIVTLVAIKPNNTVEAQFVEVENGLVYADLKPSMCDLVGNYQAKAMIVLEGEIVTTDTINYSVNEDKIISRLNEDVVSDERFTLFTDALARLSDIEASEEQRMINEAERILAEENRKIEEAKRVEAELVRQHEEADRSKYDATRESNENIRKQNESIRLANETNRIDEEAKRVEEENKRKLAEEERNANYNFMTEDEERRRLEANAHKEAENLRVQAETNRVNEEAKRRTTEQARVSAENTRVSNENTREASEVTRQTNENQRVEAETQRQNRYNSFITEAEANANNFENYTNNAKVKEEERKSNELDRKSQEARRVSNEVERISNENTRKANEVVREKNEASRQNVFENKVSEVDKKISEINITKDNFISSVNTTVNNKISEVDTAKNEMTATVTNKVNEVEGRFNALTASQQQDAEVIDARDGEVSLKARLDRDIEKANKELDKIKKLEESTVSTVETESDFTTVEATSNGYFEDVKLEGKTLVNCLKLNGDWFDAETTLETSSTTTVGLSTYSKGCDLSLLKNNTTYTIIPFVDYTVVTQGEFYIQLNTKVNGVENHLFRVYENMFNKPTLITTKELTNKNSKILFIGGKTCSYKVRSVKILILEGDHTQNPPSYFEGLKSVGQDVDEIVVSSVKGDGNLLMPLHTGITTGSYNKKNIAFSSDYSMSYTANAWGQGISVDVVGVVKGETYVVLCDTNTNMCIKGTNALNTTSDISMYSNKVEIVATSTGIGTITFKNSTEAGNISCTNLRVIKKGSKKEFSVLEQDKKRLLFYNNETQTWEKPILREWDSIEKHSDGKYYYHQRSGEVVFDGNEDGIVLLGDNTTSTLGFGINKSNFPNIKKISVYPNENKVFNDRFNYLGGTLWNVDSVGIALNADDDSKMFQVKLLKTSLNTQDVAGFKQWLQTNNMTAVYELAEEKVYECTNIDLITYANETNYIVESGAISPKSTLKVHNNISNVVSLLQKKVSLLESNITKYMITQNRMQLASTYSADSVTFKVDYFSLSNEEESYNEDLYNLILNNILVGKDNYDYDKMFTMVLDYASWNQISWEQFDILVGLMDMQHNPPVEDEIVEEIPNEIM